MADDTRVTHSRPGYACALALLCVLGLSLPAEALASDIVVRRDPGLTAAERADVRADAGVVLERMLPLANTELVSVPAAREDRALAILNADPDVRFAAPDVAVQAAADFVEQSLANGADADVDGPEAWEYAEGLGVTVGVADMSIGDQHPDLLGNVEATQDFVADGCQTTAPPSGLADHGTHVAGLIAALHDGTGTVGLAPLAHVKPLRTLDDCGVGKLSGVLAAFDYAGHADIPIVSASFATDPLLPVADRQAVDDAFTAVFADNPGTLYVVAAGNEGNDNDELPVYPCSNQAENLICVGMTDAVDKPVCWGNVGEASVDLFAPGMPVYSTVRGPISHMRLGGTSVATPLVAAAAALLESLDPLTYGPEDLRLALLNAVDYVPGLDAFSASDGRLNAARALPPRPPDLGLGGPGGAWTSCDTDHDGFHESGDKCPDLVGPVNGCPDLDRDGIRDLDDNCKTLANADQMDVDGDTVGDLCDPTPRGEDVDGDAKATLDDRCPTQPAPTADGCPMIVIPPGPPTQPTSDPTPQPPPPPPPSAARIVSVKVAVRCARRNPCRKAAKVTVRVSRAARVALKVEQRVRTRGRLRWMRITSRSLNATVSGRSLTVRGKGGRSLGKGSYRVTVTLPGTAASARSFKV
jgi:hypothetical protein